MANTIKIKTGSGSDPSASDLAVGELALRTDNGKLFSKDAGGSVIELGGGSVSDGSITSAKIANGAIVNVDVNSSAAIAGSKISPDFGSQDIVTTGNLDLSDSTGSGNNRIKLGTSDDLQLLHNSTDSIIDNATGNLFIRSASLHLQALNAEDMIVCEANGTVQLLHNNNLKFQTNSNGCRFVGMLAGIDDEKVALGTNNDLQIFHESSSNKSIIVETGSGSLDIRASSVQLQNAGGTENLAIFTSDGSCKLKHNNVDALETEAEGIKVFDDDTSVHIEMNTSTGVAGFLYGASNNNIGLLTRTGNYAIRGVEGGTTELYHNGNDVLATTADGAILSGASDIAHSSADNLQIGTGSGTNGMTIYSGSSNAGTIYFADGNSGTAQYAGFIEYNHNQNFLYFGTGGATAAYFDNSQHFVPNVDSTHDIGLTGKRWRNVFADTLYGDGSNITNLPSSSDNTKLPLSGGELTGDLITHQVRPDGNGNRELGTSSFRWQNIYTSDLDLSNEGGANDVDMTWGSFTIQEGHHDLFLINKRTNKKYKFNLTEVT